MFVQWSCGQVRRLFTITRGQCHKQLVSGRGWHRNTWCYTSKLLKSRFQHYWCISCLSHCVWPPPWLIKTLIYCAFRLLLNQKSVTRLSLGLCLMGGAALPHTHRHTHTLLFLRLAERIFTGVTAHNDCCHKCSRSFTCEVWKSQTQLLKVCHIQMEITGYLL